MRAGNSLLYLERNCQLKEGFALQLNREGQRLRISIVRAGTLLRRFQARKKKALQVLKPQSFFDSLKESRFCYLDFSSFSFSASFSASPETSPSVGVPVSTVSLLSGASFLSLASLTSSSSWVSSMDFPASSYSTTKPSSLSPSLKASLRSSVFSSSLSADINAFTPRSSFTKRPLSVIFETVPSTFEPTPFSSAYVSQGLSCTCLCPSVIRRLSKSTARITTSIC